MERLTIADVKLSPAKHDFGDGQGPIRLEGKYRIVLRANGEEIGAVYRGYRHTYGYEWTARGFGVKAVSWDSRSGAVAQLLEKIDDPWHDSPGLGG